MECKVYLTTASSLAFNRFRKNTSRKNNTRTLNQVIHSRASGAPETTHTRRRRSEIHTKQWRHWASAENPHTWRRSSQIHAKQREDWALARSPGCQNTVGREGLEKARPVMGSNPESILQAELAPHVSATICVFH
jgi:hypothetical protein